MKFKEICQYSLLATCFVSTAMTMENNPESADLLIVGCRPWDANIQDVKSIGSAHFIDFLMLGAPESIPDTFHHIDVNDNDMHSGDNLSDFADVNPNKFKTIVIDWVTYQHVRRDLAWSDFTKLLMPGGHLIIPVTYTSFKDGLQSYEKANELCNKLPAQISIIDLLAYDTMPIDDSQFDLLRRTYFKDITSLGPVIIYATKGS